MNLSQPYACLSVLTSGIVAYLNQFSKRYMQVLPNSYPISNFLKSVVANLSFLLFLHFVIKNSKHESRYATHQVLLRHGKIVYPTEVYHYCIMLQSIPSATAQALGTLWTKYIHWLNGITTPMELLQASLLFV